MSQREAGFRRSALARRNLVAQPLLEVRWFLDLGEGQS